MYLYVYLCMFLVVIYEYVIFFIKKKINYLFKVYVWYLIKMGYF